MPKIVVAYLLILFSLISCKKKDEQKVEEYPTSAERLNTIKSDKPISKLNAKSEELVAPWDEYHKFAELISQYQEIPMSDALLNSKELEELARELKDSIRVERLDIPAIKMRLNVLHSETMRLADMATIPTITEEAVTDENNNVIEAFSALNLKINNMSSVEKLNEEISSFIDEVIEEQDSIPIEKEGPP